MQIGILICLDKGKVLDCVTNTYSYHYSNVMLYILALKCLHCYAYFVQNIIPLTCNVDSDLEKKYTHIFKDAYH